MSEAEKIKAKLAEAGRKVITVDRAKYRLRLFERRADEVKLEEVERYPIAVGAQGHRTPHGVWLVNSKVKDPDWLIPASDWTRDAGLVPGTVVPGGTEENPLKARWIGVTEPRDGVGIHGTASVESIGTAASHGCIRMREKDVIDLYEQVPIGAFVVIF